MNLVVADVPMATNCDNYSNTVIGKEGCDSYKKYLIFVAGLHDCIILHELKNVQSTVDFHEDNAVRPTSYDVIRRPGQYISGMKLSHDHRLVAMNSAADLGTVLINGSAYMNTSLNELKFGQV